MKLMPSSEERKQFESVYLDYFQAIHDFCNSFLKHGELARDLAQDTFFALWNNFNPAYTEKEILSFLYTTARNKCFDQLRLQKVVENKIRDLKDTIYSDTFFLDEITRNETYRIIRESINKLPDRSRQIALLTLQGYSIQEIADQLEISINTIKTLKKNVYAKLREIIKNQYVILLLLKYFI